MATTTKIRHSGKDWKMRVSRQPLKGSWGHCDYDKREIVICKTAVEKGIEREILIHEILHKIMPFLEEDCVEHAAIELDNALDACGY
jgi:hypothetical protein